ncbi:MAG: hypothetical protein ABIV10_10300, partial [Gemmatimonadaceae bacterium]
SNLCLQRTVSGAWKTPAGTPNFDREVVRLSPHPQLPMILHLITMPPDEWRASPEAFTRPRFAAFANDIAQSHTPNGNTPNGTRHTWIPFPSIVFRLPTNTPNG